MSKALAKLVRLADERRRERMQVEERDALSKLEKEAAAGGVSFKYPSNVRLAPSKALGILRMDGYRCRLCGGGKQLTISGEPSNFTTVCTSCDEG